MKRRELRKSIIGTPMEDIALDQFQKSQYKGVGQKRRLNILKNEVFIGNIICNYPENKKTDLKKKRATLYDFVGGKKKRHNLSNSVDLTKSAIQSIKGNTYIKQNIHEYVIENPVTKGRSLSSAKKERKNNFLMSTKNEIENAKINIQLFKMNLDRIPKVIKDKDYYAKFIQEYWKKYKEYKLEKEYNKIKCYRKLARTINSVFCQYYLKLKEKFFYRVSIIKPKLIEVSISDYYLIQHLKEIGVNNVNDFRNLVFSISRNFPNSNNQ
jgi:hypothetical protein